MIYFIKLVKAKRVIGTYVADDKALAQRSTKAPVFEYDEASRIAAHANEVWLLNADERFEVKPAYN